MKQFYINPVYVCSITKIQYDMDITGCDLLNSIKGAKVRGISSDEHQVFKNLRDQLEAEGYIRTQRSSWNGDRVLKPFRLNDKVFNTGSTFYSAAALKYQLTS